MNLNFRDLTAEDVELRASMVRDSFISLLAYKDARVDASVLDETVGAMNWKKTYRRDETGALVCTVSVWNEDRNEWVGKEDVGVESNTEKVKGEYSDAMKRSCSMWGIGRELYSAPEIKIWAKSKNADGSTVVNANIEGGKCYDKFKVTKMVVENKKIVEMEVFNETIGRKVFSFNKNSSAKAEKSASVKAEKTAKVETKTPANAEMTLEDALNYSMTGANGKKVAIKDWLSLCKTEESQKKMMQYLYDQVKQKTEAMKPCLMVYHAIKANQVSFG